MIEEMGGWKDSLLGIRLVVWMVVWWCGGNWEWRMGYMWNWVGVYGGAYAFMNRR